ncbi:alpha/beta-hydrolase [Fomes fomentarius]|nr:alpha/beta-hydrolase [Fomes fomentarius]
MLFSLTAWPFFTPLLTIPLSVTHALAAYPREPKLEWVLCDASVVTDPHLDCAFLTVPLDFHDPEVGNARIAVAKVNATGKRRGTVFYNPGGPAIPGVTVLNDSGARNSLLSATGGVYDIVSWDPRGVGTLTVPGSVFCFDSVREYNEFFNGTIELTGIEETGNFTDPADTKALLSQAPIMQEKYRQVEQKCLNGPSGKYLGYMGTAAAVRDMVSMANILDGPDAPINYIGVSYGTIIGAWFVNMFPERVGRVIIDGIVNPETFATQETSTVWDSQQYESADTTYKGLITGCALAGPQGCPAASEGDGPLDIDSKFQALINAAHDATQKNTSVPLTSGHIRLDLLGAMYNPANWSTFMNDYYPWAVSVVCVIRDRRVQATLTPLYSQIRRQNQMKETRSYSDVAIFCRDSVDVDPHVNMTDVFKAAIKGTQTISHILTCSFWPVRVVERYQGPFNKTLANRILITSHTYDPVTPLSGAQALAGFLGDSARLVRLNGLGHTPDASPSACMYNILVAYMVNGTLPANGTVCEVDADYEVFPGVTTADILANLPTSDI